MMEKKNQYTTNELMAVTASRLIKDGQNIVVGLGLPQVATQLAKETHAPELNIIFEIGVINPELEDAGVGVADPRYWCRADHYTGFIGTLGKMLQRGLVDVGFLGGLEVDKFGNINSTLTRRESGVRHFTGSGGAADIASFAKTILIIMRHEKRKLVEKLNHLTSVGYLKGGDSREREGLPCCHDIKVITNLCVFGFHEDRSINVESIHPGGSVEEVLENTGISLHIDEGIATTAEPREEELRLLRTKIDPKRLYL